MTRIKICGITRIEDALEAVRRDADALGLVFYERSPRAVGVETACRLVKSVPPFISIVGLFVNATAEFVRGVTEQVPLNLLQFHGEESGDFCAQFDLPYIKAIRVRQGVDLIQCASEFSRSKGLLLDAHVEGMHGGTGATFDWKLIPRMLPLPVILSGGLHADNVAGAIEQVRPYAVDVSSGVEAAKGIKDAAKIAAFVNEVKRIDLQLS